MSVHVCLEVQIQVAQRRIHAANQNNLERWWHFAAELRANLVKKSEKVEKKHFTRHDPRGPQQKFLKVCNM